MMKEQELNNLLDKAIGTKGNLKVPSFWMRKIFKELIEWCKSLNNSLGPTTNTKWSILQGYQERYLTFEALEDGTFSFTSYGYGDSMWYSKNNSTWTELPSGELVSVAAGDKVMWKSTLIPNIYNGMGTFSSSNKFNVSGNIMSLSYGDDFIGKTSLENDRTYTNLFGNCENLFDAKNLILPATTLAGYCYSGMFNNCTALTTAPALPATALTDGCYYHMFENCSSLISAPELPATNLTIECYSNMFSGCSSLTTAPELPAATLADNCYSYMFQGCSSLVTAPELPAITLARGCYGGMFINCTSLVTPPALPATTLAYSCYSSMFSGCSSLTTAPELPATALTDYCYQNMFYGCKSLTSVLELPATTLADHCYYFMFQGCTKLTSVPEILPATTLANYCYCRMFCDCPKLTSAPELPATTLVKGCYSSMFMGCYSLNSITMLATDYSASYCLSDWVRDVSSSGTFVKHPDMTSLPAGINGIPKGWTVEDAVIS